MTEKKYIVALDQGTTSSRAVVMDHDANIISVSQREFEQIYPKPGWVEHDPMEIWATQSSTLVEVLAKADISSDQIAAIGITNQRETYRWRDCRCICLPQTDWSPFALRYLCCGRKGNHNSFRTKSFAVI